MNKRISTIIFLVTRVALLAAVACGSSSTAVPTGTPIKGPPPTETPGSGDSPPEEPAPVAVPAPIESSTVVLPATPGGDYILKIISGLPNGCAEFNGYEVKQDGDRFIVEVTNLVPHPSLMVECIEIYGSHEAEVVLGSGLVDGGTYTAEINGEWTQLFIAHGESGQGMVEKESPIEEIMVAEVNGGYILNVTSRLPKGSSCSLFNGYTVNRRFAGRIEVSLTHLEVTGDNVPCTADLPVVVTGIALDADFAEGTTYTVSVNGTETTFPSQEMASVEIPAPIEDATVLPPESVGGDYILKITSGLPSGCAQFNGLQIERDGNGFIVGVTNLMPDPKEPIACTAIYGYHDSEIILGSGLDTGESYTVTINGDLAASFTVQGETANPMVEKESPIESVEVAEADTGYTLTVVSRLPKGSSCSSFNGYHINRRFFDRIEVTVTHFEVSEDNVPCTRDLPVVVTEIQLGDNFESGRSYSVSVNGEETAFTAR